jgi:hypothetical protein
MINLLLSRVANRSGRSCIGDELTGEKGICNCSAKTKRLFSLTENREMARRGSLINSGNFGWSDAGCLSGKTGLSQRKGSRLRGPSLDF